MEITSIKPSGFKVTLKSTTIILNPESIDSTFYSNSVILSSKINTNFRVPNSSNDSSRIFSLPGEFTYKGNSILSIPIYKDKPDLENELLFIIRGDNQSLAYLPSLKSELSSETIERIGNITVLILNVDTEPKIIQNTIEEIEPKAIIPFSQNQVKVNEVLTIMGKSNVERKLKHQIKSSIGETGLEILLLE